jgi:hypothetical protein
MESKNYTVPFFTQPALYHCRLRNKKFHHRWNAVLSLVTNHIPQRTQPLPASASVERITTQNWPSAKSTNLTAVTGCKTFYAGQTGAKAS